MNAQVSPLCARQAALQRRLQHGDVDVAAFVRDERRDARLRLYADAYRLRLAEALGNDFPALRAHLGEDVFAALAEAYLHAHPSTHKSLRWFGREFPDWLRQRDALAAQLARFEWLQGEAFDAADAPPSTLQALTALPPHAWPNLRLSLQPALRLLRAPASVPVLVDAFNRDEVLPPLRDEDAADWRLWRRELQVHWHRLDADEAALLRLAQTGADFAQLCEALQPFHDENQIPARAIGLLKRWLEDGLIAAIDTCGE